MISDESSSENLLENEDQLNNTFQDENDDGTIETKKCGPKSSTQPALVRQSTEPNVTFNQIEKEAKKVKTLAYESKKCPTCNCQMKKRNGYYCPNKCSIKNK